MKDLDKLSKSMKSQKLTSAEKQEVKQNLLSYIRNNPVSIPSNKRLLLHKPFLTLKRSSMLASIIIIASLVLGGGVSYAAEQSLPGDALYPVKVSVNEEVREALSFSDESKADWALRRAERRLEEAEKLSDEERLDDEARDKVEERFDAHAERVENLIKRLQESDIESAADISARLRASLEAHEQVLTRLEAKGNGNVARLRQRLQERKESSLELDDDIEDEVVDGDEDEEEEMDEDEKDDEDEDKEEEDEDDEDEERDEDKAQFRMRAAEGMKKAAQNKINSTERFINAKSKDLSEEEQERAQAQLQLALDAVAEGDTQFEAGEYGQAFLSYKSAVRLAQEAKVFIRAHSDLDVSATDAIQEKIDELREKLRERAEKARERAEERMEKEREKIEERVRDEAEEVRDRVRDRLRDAFEDDDEDEERDEEERDEGDDESDSDEDADDEDRSGSDRASDSDDSDDEDRSGSDTGSDTGSDSGSDSVRDGEDGSAVDVDVDADAEVRA